VSDFFEELFASFDVVDVHYSDVIFNALFIWVFVSLLEEFVDSLLLLLVFWAQLE